MPNTLKRVSVGVLVANEANIRTDIGDVGDLAESIVNTGLLEPLVVYKDGDEFHVIAGHRRLAAIQLAIANGVLPEVYLVDVIVRPKPSEQEQIAMMLVENMQRVDLPIKDQVHGVFALVATHGWTQAQVAEALGQSVQMVKQRAKWGELDDKILDRATSDLTAGALDLLVKLKPENLAKLTSKKNWSSWDVESAIRDQKQSTEQVSFCRNLEKCGHLVVNMATADGMPTVVQAYLDNLDGDKVTTKVTVWNPKQFLELALSIVTPALLLVAKAGYNTDVSVVTRTEEALAWKKSMPSQQEEEEVDESELTDYEIEERRLENEYVAAVAEYRTAVKAAQLTYLTETGPATLVTSLLGSFVSKAFRHSTMGITCKEALAVVMDTTVDRDDAKFQSDVLNFASKNASNLARVAATISVYDYAGIEVPAVEALGSCPSRNDYRVSGDEFDEDGRRLTPEELAAFLADQPIEDVA